MRTRFDLKDSKLEINLEGEDAIQLASVDEYKLQAVTEILRQSGEARRLAEGAHVWQSGRCARRSPCSKVSPGRARDR